MKVNKVIPEKTIPSFERNETITNINLDIRNRIVMITTIDNNDYEQSYTVSYGNEWNGMTITQKNTVIAFFKRIVKLALNVTDQDIED